MGTVGRESVGCAGEIPPPPSMETTTKETAGSRPRLVHFPRSSRSDVRNPLLALPSAAAFRELPAAQREPLRALLLDLAAAASWRAEESWRRHKAPMAAYWKAVAVYARHAARLLR